MHHKKPRPWADHVRTEKRLKNTHQTLNSYYIGVLRLATYKYVYNME